MLQGFMQNHAGAQKHVQEDKKNSRSMLQGFMQNHAGAKKHVQYKKNRGWTVLNGGHLASHKRNRANSV